VPVAAIAKVDHQLAAPGVIGDQQQHQRELGVQPGARARKPADPEPQAEHDREQRAWRRDAPEKLALHDLEALERNRVLGLRVIHEQARQIEKPREPGHHENEMERFDEQH